jgi:predicted aconitase/predicted aconitase with swiveling domain
MGGADRVAVTTQQSSTGEARTGRDAEPGALAEEVRALAAGERGPAAALAMRVVQAVARASGATGWRRITSAHVDGCLYHGRAGLDFARRLVDLDGRVTVRTTLNVGSLDLRPPDTVRADPGLREAGAALMDAYVALGCEQTWTCAPYQISHRPAVGEHVAWAESNAIAFVNSVLGARTDRYGDFIDIAAAITGLVPDAGLHSDAARRATMVLDCSQIPTALWESDAAWAALGALLGEVAGTRVAALTGLPGDLADGGRTEDRLKAVASTAASAGGVALFHVVGVTPEAPDLATVLRLGLPPDTAGIPDPGAASAPTDTPRPAGARVRVRTAAVTAAMLRAARDRLTTATGAELDAVSLGTPHFSVSEFAALAAELDGGVPFDPAVDVYVSTSRAVLAEAEQHGYLAPLRAAGGRIVTDTCTYVTPILDPSVRTVMTNSGKWAWYAPGNLGIDVALGTMTDCIASARAGRVIRDEGQWADVPVTASHPGSAPTGGDPGGARADIDNSAHGGGGTESPGMPAGSGVTGVDSPGQAAAPIPAATAPATPIPAPAHATDPQPSAHATGPQPSAHGFVLHPGTGSGELLTLDEPLSFWGGVSAEGIVIDRHHPHCGESVAGRILAMSTGRGSSSSSSVLAELIRAGRAPAAIVLAEDDTIIVLGAVVAAEIYGIEMPVLRLDPVDLAALPHDGFATVRTPKDANLGSGMIDVGMHQ